jgi:hypothetical protein
MMKSDPAVRHPIIAARIFDSLRIPSGATAAMQKDVWQRMHDINVLLRRSAPCRHQSCVRAKVLRHLILLRHDEPR